MSRLYAVLSVFVVVIVLSSCGSVGVAKNQPNEILTVSEFAVNPSDFAGKEVTIAGYLGVVSRSLVIYPNREEAERFNFQEGAVFVYDTSSNRQLGLEGVDSPFNCTRNYVSLTGIGGTLKGLNVDGVIEIKSITVFENDSFQGVGRICYP